MKHLVRSTIIALTAITLIPAAAFADDLRAEDEASILFMREEEKLAHDVYVVLGDEHGLPVFSNIAAAELQHMSAVLTLVDEYELDDPVLGEGVFTNAELQSLYDELVARSVTSLEEALRVGALIEEVDIADLIESIDATDRDDVAAVYERLLAGSYNHLRAFVSQLERIGVDYEPVVLSGEAYADIVLGDSGSGRGPGRGGRPRGRWSDRG